MMRTAWVCVLVSALVGCRTVEPTRLRFERMASSGGSDSNSGNSSQGSGDSGDSSQSNSGNSSQSNSGNSSQGSGNSSQGSGNSSQSNSGNSSEGSGNSSQGSGQSSNNSSQGSGQSTANSNDSTGQSAPSSVRSSEQTGNGVNGSLQASADSTAATGGRAGQSSAQSTRNSAAWSVQLTIQPMLSTVVLAGTAALVGLAIWGGLGLTAATADQPGQREKQGAAAAAYLRANENQLRQDLALGAGRTVEDLAAAAGIRPENLPRFGRMLRRHRAELLAHLDGGPITHATALELLGRIGELAKQDPALAEDYRAFMAAHGG